jgi:hypothetical protein
VRLHCVTESVNAFDGRIGGSVKTDRIIGTADVIVNSGWYADYIDTVL